MQQSRFFPGSRCTPTGMLGGGGGSGAGAHGDSVPCPHFGREPKAALKNKICFKNGFRSLCSWRRLLLMKTTAARTVINVFNNVQDTSGCGLGGHPLCRRKAMAACAAIHCAKPQGRGYLFTVLTAPVSKNRIKRTPYCDWSRRKMLMICFQTPPQHTLHLQFIKTSDCAQNLPSPGAQVTHASCTGATALVTGKLFGNTATLI